MVNEIPFKKKKENAPVLAWCNNIKLWPGKFLYILQCISLFLYFLLNNISSEASFKDYGFPLSFLDSVSVIPCYRAVLKKTFKVRFNRPFPSSKKSHFQSEAKCEAIDVKIIFNYDANKTHFHNNGFALSLVLKVRVFGTRK